VLSFEGYVKRIASLVHGVKYCAATLHVGQEAVDDRSERLFAIAHCMLSQTGFLNRLIYRLLRCNKSGIAVRANKGSEQTQAPDWPLLKARRRAVGPVAAVLPMEQHIAMRNVV
jgi:hypothetical protein